MNKIFLHISQSNDKLFHYNITKNHQYLVSAYDGFKTYDEAEHKGVEKLMEIVKEKK